MADDGVDPDDDGERHSIWLVDAVSEFSHIPRGSLTIKRRLYTQDVLDIEYVERRETVFELTMEEIEGYCSCTMAWLRKFLLNLFPLIGVVRRYSLKDLAHDCFAGVSVSFLHIPQGLALGLLASVPPVYGLYSTFYPVLIYLIFGTCRHVSMGTNAILSILTAGIVEREFDDYVQKRTGHALGSISVSPNGTATASHSPLSEDDIVNFKVGVASAITLVTGAFLLAMSFLKLGFSTVYMSPPFVRGFTTACALHIATSQIPKMLHINVPPYTGAGKIVKTYIDIFKNIGDSNPADVIVAVISCIFLLSVTIFVNERYRHKLRVPIPVLLITVVMAILISNFAELEDKYGVAVVGDIPLGLPAPSFPDTDAWGRIVVDSFVMAILIFTLTITIAKLMSEEYNYDIDPDQELFAYGMCNFVGAFFQCIATSTGPPRSMILGSTGARSTMNGAATALFILLTLMVVGKVFVSLPVAVLAAMIATAVKNLLLQVNQLPGLWLLSKPDFFIWVITFATSVLGDLDIGILAGMGISGFTFIFRNQVVKGVVGGLSKFEDLVLFGRQPRYMEISNRYKIFYFPAQLCFANSERFTNQLYSKALDPRLLRPVPADDEPGGSGRHSHNTDLRPPQSGIGLESNQDQDIRHVIIECSAITYIDTAGATALKKACGQYKKVGVTLMLAKCPSYTLRVLDRAGYFEVAGRRTVFYDVYDAISCIQQDFV